MIFYNSSFLLSDYGRLNTWPMKQLINWVRLPVWCFFRRWLIVGSALGSALRAPHSTIKQLWNQCHITSPLLNYSIWLPIIWLSHRCLIFTCNPNRCVIQPCYGDPSCLFNVDHPSLLKQLHISTVLNPSCFTITSWFLDTTATQGSTMIEPINELITRIDYELTIVNHHWPSSNHWFNILDC